MNNASSNDEYLDDINAIIDQVRARQTDDALGSIESCLPKYPNSPELLLLASVCSYQQDDIGRAIELCEQAHKLAPDGQEIVDSLAVLYVLAGNHTDGLYYAKLATTLTPHPDIPDLLPLEFSDFFRALNMTRPSQHYLTGLFEYNSRNFEKAANELQRELRINTNNQPALKKLGQTLVRFHRPTDALNILDAYAQNNAIDGEVSALMALAHCQLAQFDEAAALCRRALEEDTESLDIPLVVLESTMFFEGDLAIVHEEALANLHARIGKKLEEDDFEASEPNAVRTDIINIAIVCNSLYEGSTARFLMPYLENHDSKRFNITIYQQSPTGGSMFNELKSKSPNWRRIIDIDDDVVEMIMTRSGADIILDLCGFSENGRPLLLSQLGNRVVTNLFCAPHADGTPGANLLLSDAATADADKASLKDGQRSVVTDGGLFAINEPRLMGDVRELPALANGHITFGGTANLEHLSPSTVAMWSDILNAVPGSKLHLGYVENAFTDVKERAASLFDAAGLKGRVSVWNTDYDQRTNPTYFNAVDIFLDTYPVNRTLDLCHALWMGVPVITRRGATRNARMGASIVNSAGKPEWIADTHEDYVKIAASLAGDINGLASVREILRDDLKASKLMDTKGYAKGLEAAFEKCLDGN